MLRNPADAVKFLIEKEKYRQTTIKKRISVLYGRQFHVIFVLYTRQ